MLLDDLRAYFLSKPGVTAELPFGPDTLVFKAGGRVFALIPLEGEGFAISLKCDPERAVQLRETYAWIVPGYHLNKQHWNTLTPPATAPLMLLHELISHSYDLVVQKLPKSQREGLISS